MKIEGDRIIFKSSPNNYFKERDGQKCNTLRRFSGWEELRDFERFKDEVDFNEPNKTIRIYCDFEGWFERTITDITPFEGYYIISWKHKEETK